MKKFDKKTVIVTGAAGALGSGVAQYFSEQGARVAHLDYSDELLNKSFPSQGEEHLYIAVDLTNRQQTLETIQKVEKAFGTVNILANIAGGFTMGEKVHETSDQTWDFLFNLNTRSIIHTAAATVPIMEKSGGGKIINIAANAAKQGAALMGAYLASKSAVWRLTESMALELREQHINVNCILPGTIDTPRNRKDMPDADFSKWVKPEEFAKVIGFLASDESRMIHGAAIPVLGLG
jgi:NAD(P)-dependent dehydrogenase (short-subunit alcohol dehydrogenase family)